MSSNELVLDLSPRENDNPLLTIISCDLIYLLGLILEIGCHGVVSSIYTYETSSYSGEELRRRKQKNFTRSFFFFKYSTPK